MDLSVEVMDWNCVFQTNTTINVAPIGVDAIETTLYLLNKTTLIVGKMRELIF